MKLQMRVSEFEEYARKLGGAADQLPFALSSTLNDAVKRTRKVLVDHTWPRGVNVRSSGFINWALRTEFANKKSLRVTIYSRAKNVDLLALAKGGVKTPQHGQMLAVPTRRIKRTSRGVAKQQRPRNLKNAVRKGDTILQRVRNRLRLMYILVRRARIKKQVDFFEDFEGNMRVEMRRQFPRLLANAMATRRK